MANLLYPRSFFGCEDNALNVKNNNNNSEKVTSTKKQNKKGHKQLSGNCVWLPGRIYIEDQLNERSQI